MSDTKDEDVWISVKNSMPGIGKVIEILFMNGSIRKCKFCYCKKDTQFCFSIKSEIIDSSYCLEEEKITHWRPIKERKPDFGKLKEGDFLIIIYEDPEDKYFQVITGCGYYIFMHDAKFILNPESIFKGVHNLRLYKFDNVKRISRVNIEKQTFEEI